MIDALVKAIYTKLSGTSAVTTLLSSATAIYFHQAPLNAVLPYIVFILSAGGDDHLTPTESADVRFTIKGVAKSATTAGAIAGAIRNALHEQTVTIDSPWTVYRCQHDELIAYTENVDREQYHHFGGIYRIRISQ